MPSSIIRYDGGLFGHFFAIVPHPH